MSRTHGRSAAGERAYSKRPGIRGGNISLVGAIRLDEEPTLYPFDGPVDEDRFLSFLDRLIPSLNDGDVVIMDNCSIHKTESVKVKLATVGARPLFLPPYSPELNPVEQAWSNGKRKTSILDAHIFYLCEISFRFFVAHGGVEPTINLAKRDLRPAVIWSKSKFVHAV